MSHINPDLRETHIVGSQTREQIVSSQNCQELAFYHMWMAGISSALPPFRFVRHHQHISQLLLCLEGCGTVCVDGQWQPCSAGMAYLTPADTFHAYYANETAPWKVCWIIYDAQKMEQPLITVKAPTLLQAEPQDVHSLFTAIEGLYHESLGLAEEVVLHHWVQLVQIYAQRVVRQKRMDQRLQQAWKTVDTNLAHAWNNDELARQAGISSEHLRRLCQQQCGHSPMQHVRNMRMQRAMALLATDLYSVESVAEHVGYENPYAFSTAFKRHTGIPPSSYRRRHER